MSIEKSEALNGSESYLRLLMEYSADMILILDACRVVCYESPSAERIWGYAPTELIGRDMIEWVHPDDHPGAIDALDRMVRSADMPMSMEFRFLYKDGSWHVLEATGRNLLENEAVRGIVVNLHEITARKAAEHDLVREKNQFQALIDLYRRADARIGDIEAFVIEECVRISESPLGFFGFINEEETEMKTHLWSKEAMKGCGVEFKPVVFSLRHAGIWAEAIRNREPFIINDYSQPDARKKGCPEGHVPIRRLLSIPIIKGTRVVAVMAVANKKLDYDETDVLHLSLFIESMWDMLKRKEAEEEIRMLNEELERKVEERTHQLIQVQEELVRKEKLAILGRLAGIVGHEIRNPLAAMNNAVYFLKTAMSGADDVVKEYLGIIKQEIDNSQRIISDLLDFSRTKTPQARPVAVRELVAESLGKCCVPDNIEVLTDISDALPEINIDPFQMGQVLQNLIANAVQAMPEGGGLDVGARLVQGSAVQGADSSMKPEGDWIEIRVRDSGEGISPENMGKLFQPLFTTKPKGIGLGLVACRNLTEANGGRIEVESRVGAGTTFRVLLPTEEAMP